MTITEIISGLKFTIEMILFDPNTGEEPPEPRNDMDKITLDACKGAIEALEQTRWIPVSERLPENGDTYLVTIEYNGEVIGVDAASYSPVEGYIDKHWDTFNDWKEDDDACYHVTAWMALPPYKVESEEEE